MGQQSSRQNCGCGAWERRAQQDTPPPPQLPHASNVHRYVSAVADSDGAARYDCSCRRRRWLPSRRPRPACVCTAYRSVSETESAPPPCRAPCVGVLQRCTNCGDNQSVPCVCDSRLAAVLALGARELRREPYAVVELSQPTGNTNNATEGGSGAGEGEGPAGGAAAGAGAELLLWSVAYPHLAHLDPEDLEERARALRALEIAQGVEPPPGYRPRLQVVYNGELRALLLRAAASPAPPPPNLSFSRVHTQIDYIHCLVPDLREITACCFYWGKMDRYEAERLLDNKPEGTFLLRDSAQEEHLFSVSFRKYGRSLHARIEHFNHKFSFDSHDPAVFCADTVTQLIHHYKDPACVMFFEPMLTAPLARTQPFSLQQLARAVIVSSTTYDGVEALPLPARLRAYLKEYHYRQRVRVRRLDSLACLHRPIDIA